MLSSRLAVPLRCARVWSHCQARSFTRSAVLSSDLPYHVVVGMPALSPTMETGILAEWYVGEGQTFSAGEALAKIETDKASIDFEAQDDGAIAKIFMEAGTGEDVPVGTPIMVTVEEEEDVKAFANFVLEEAPAAPASPEEPAAPEPAAPPAPEPEVVQAAAAPEVPPPAPVAPEPVVAPPSMEALAEAVAPVMSTGWGHFAKINSPLINTLSKQQKEYVAKYGTAGQVPL